jgi:hypothetical protein
MQMSHRIRQNRRHGLELLPLELWFCLALLLRKDLIFAGHYNGSQGNLLMRGHVLFHAF